MVPTAVPDNVDYMAIAMEEKARIRDKMPSAILNVASGTRRGSTPDNDASSGSGEAQVSFRFSAVRKTHSHMHSYLHTEKLGHFYMVLNPTQVDIFTYAR